MAVSRTMTREYGTGVVWQDHCTTCLRKVGGNWGTVTHGTGTVQICGCNCGMVCDLCCLSGDQLYTCTNDSCKIKLRKINPGEVLINARKWRTSNTLANAVAADSPAMIVPGTEKLCVVARAK